ncbi:MAG: Hpt domain-containing protein, partial [Alphaproteobacteria bacterium]|nr:Hpt domain-containing protein [Alphaproteobacteria bacterium]
MSPKAPPSGQAPNPVETIHTTLTGLSLMCLVLLMGVLLPVFGWNPLHSADMAVIITGAVLVGVAYLYLLNYKTHNTVSEQASLTDVLMNSLGQGFLTFDEKGICRSGYSEATLNLLQCEQITGKQVADLLQVPEENRGDFFEWLGILFMPGHALSFEDAARFMPGELTHQNGKMVELSYRPVRHHQGNLECIVLIITDKTEEKEAQKRVDEERQFVAMVCAIFAEKQSFILTMSEIKQMLDRLATIDENLFSADFFRDVHTIKGAAMHFKMEVLGEKLHGLESTLRDVQEVMSTQGITMEAKEAASQRRAEVHLEFARIQNSLRAILGEEDTKAQGIVEVDENSLYDFGKLLKQKNVSPDIYYAFQKTLL